MKLKYKRICMIFSFLFILLISLAMVSAGGVEDDSNVLALSDESLTINDGLDNNLDMVSGDSSQDSNLNDACSNGLESDSKETLGENINSEPQATLNENGGASDVLYDGKNGHVLSVGDIAATEGTNVSIVAKVSQNGAPVSSGYVCFYLWTADGTPVEDYSLVKDGQAVLNITLPKVSQLSYLNWNCEAEFYDEADLQANANFSVQIKRAVNPTTIIADNVIGKMDKKVTLVANVYDTDGLKVSAGTVTFTVNGKSYKVNVKNGKASKVITSPFVGLYTVKVKYNGVGAYKSSSSSFKLLSDLKIKSRYYKILNVKKGAKKYYKITLTNYYTKKPVKNFKLKFKVKVNKKTWKTYTLKSNSKGIIKWSTRKLSKGTHNVVIKSAYKIFDLSMKGKIIVR